jgi:hypothetical protein
MKKFFVEVPLEADATAASDDLEAQLESILEHLDDLDGIYDPDLVATLATGHVLFTMVVEGEDQLDAVIRGLVALRTAIHACDGATPGWESLFRLDDSRGKAGLVDA